MAAAGAVLSSLHATTHNAKTEKGSVRMSVWVEGMRGSSLEHVTDTSPHGDHTVTTSPNERVGPSRSEQVVDVPDGGCRVTTDALACNSRNTEITDYTETTRISQQRFCLSVLVP